MTATLSPSTRADSQQTKARTAERERYLVWSHEHGAWWRADSSGYTSFLKAAGVYSREDAISICAGARNGWQSECAPSEIPVRYEDACECEDRVRSALLLANPKPSGAET